MSGLETEFIDDTQTAAPAVDVDKIKQEAKQEAMQEITQRLTGKNDAGPTAWDLMLNDPDEFQRRTASQAAAQAAFQADVNHASEWLEENHPDLDEVEREAIGAMAGGLMKQAVKEGKALSVKAAMKKAAEKYTGKANQAVTDNSRNMDLRSSSKPAKTQEVNFMTMTDDEYLEWKRQNVDY